MIKNILIASAAVFIAGSAQAVTLTSSVAFDTGTVGHIIDDFEAPVAGISLSGSYTIDALSVSGIRAEPAGDTTNYFATPGSTMPVPGAAIIDLSGYVAAHGNFRTISFYWGSIDSYNGLTLGGNGLTGQTVYSGTDINNPANGNQSAGATNRRVTFTFAPGEQLTGLALSSGSRAFEIDNIAGNVPEPATWAMLLAGFAMVGGAVRVRSRSVAA